ncbi:helix-turn-helix transcriptional regulator [Methylocystis sp.]|uniref:helix-turn-helix transcriptional regulator n=1 Tax=Methylocystis sp. TaxID=1911079 RepID=UPI003DA1F760
MKEKIDAVRPNGRRGIEHAVGIAVHPPTPQGGHDHIPTLRDAIEARRIVDMRYRTLDETRGRRIVRRLRLEFWWRAWTLTAWRELRSDFRVFRVERIENLEVTDRGFRDERGKSYKDYLDAAETPC